MSVFSDVDKAIERAARAMHESGTWDPETHVIEDWRNAARALVPDGLLATGPQRHLDAVLEDVWDDGNCTGLDGWIGPGRGIEVDDEAVRRRARSVEKARQSVRVGENEATREQIAQIVDPRFRKDIPRTLPPASFSYEAADALLARFVITPREGNQ